MIEESGLMVGSISHKKFNISKLIVVLIMFLGVFMPCLIRVRMQYVVISLELITILFMLIFDRKLTFNRNTIKVFGAFIPFLLYYSISIILNGLTSTNSLRAYLDEYTQIIFVFLYAFVSIIFIQKWIQTSNEGFDGFSNLMTVVATIQLICVMLAFMFPQVKTFFNNLTIQNSLSEVIVNVTNNKWRMSYRAYGLAENLYDRFGYAISILISLSFLKGISTNNRKKIALSLAMLMMPLLNARTGLLLSGVGIVIIMFNYFKPKRVFSYLAIVIALIVSFALVFNHLPTRLQLALTNGVDATRGLLGGNGKTDVYLEIFENDIVIPQNILFGAGLSPERKMGYSGIDSGYIQCLWRYGIIGTLLLLGGYAYSFILAVRYRNTKERKVLIIVILTIFFTYLFKLFSLVNYGNVFLLFVILGALISNKTDNQIDNTV